MTRRRTAVADTVTVECAVEPLLLGIVVARGCSVRPAPPDLSSALDEAIGGAKVRPRPEAALGRVRDLLRHGRYKPTGRGKPASEYLLNAARDDRFPRINNLVDINNLVSLESLLPISLVDLGRAASTRFVVRHGRPSESYVFNQAGQRIDLEDLIVVARLPDDEPCASPVKDSMATKLDERSTDVLAVLYAPAALRIELARATERFDAAVRAWGGAKATAHGLV